MISIEIKGDGEMEANETFYPDLFRIGGDSPPARSCGIGTIRNDD
jgi:hypothetical protein